MDLLIPIVLLVVGLAVGGAVTYFLLGRLLGKKPGDDIEGKILTASREIGAAVGLFAVLGILALAISCLGLSKSNNTAAATFGIDLLVGGAAGALGGLLGFVFGVPRTVDVPRKAGDADGAATTVALGANTNLERVSDWLTALLIGATLVQIRDIPHWVRVLSDYIGDSDGLTNAKLIPFVCLYFFVLAFLGVYLITRLYLTFALKVALGLVSTTAGVPGPVLLGERLSNATKDGTAEDLQAALKLLSDWQLSDAQRSDPKLNARAVFALGKYLATGKADDVAARREQMKRAVEAAAKDPAQRAAIKAALQDKSLTSGDAATDQELSRLVS